MNAPTYPVYDGIAQGSRILRARLIAQGSIGAQCGATWTDHPAGDGLETCAGDFGADSSMTAKDMSCRI